MGIFTVQRKDLGIWSAWSEGGPAPPQNFVSVTSNWGQTLPVNLCGSELYLKTITTSFSSGNHGYYNAYFGCSLFDLDDGDPSGIAAVTIGNTTGDGIRPGISLGWDGISSRVHAQVDAFLGVLQTTPTGLPCWITYNRRRYCIPAIIPAADVDDANEADDGNLVWDFNNAVPGVNSNYTAAPNLLTMRSVVKEVSLVFEYR